MALNCTKLTKIIFKFYRRISAYLSVFLYGTFLHIVIAGNSSPSLCSMTWKLIVVFPDVNSLKVWKLMCRAAYKRKIVNIIFTTTHFSTFMFLTKGYYYLFSTLTMGGILVLNWTLLSSEVNKKFTLNKYDNSYLVCSRKLGVGTIAIWNYKHS